MWSPTHVNVIIRKAKNLLAKGKNETNNAFVVIELGKESYRTSIKDKADRKLVVWQEECECKIPTSGNKANLVLTALHRNAYGLDEFLGTVSIPLSSFDKNDNATRWYRLQGKPGRDRHKTKNRGELEITLQFNAKPSQSLMNLADKKKSKSLVSLLTIRKGDKVLSFKDLTRKAFRKKEKGESGNPKSKKPSKNLDPGVLSDDEDDMNAASRSGSTNTLISRNSEQSGADAPVKPPRIFTSQILQESPGKPPLERKVSNSCLDLRELSKAKQDDRKCLSSVNLQNVTESHSNIFSKFSRKLRLQSEKKELKKYLEALESGDKSKQAKSVLAQFSNKSREELITMIIELQRKVNRFHVHVLDLEEYLDRLLLKVMETSPTLLEKQYAL